MRLVDKVPGEARGSVGCRLCRADLQRRPHGPIRRLREGSTPPRFRYTPDIVSPARRSTRPRPDLLACLLLLACARPLGDDTAEADTDTLLDTAETADTAPAATPCTGALEAPEGSYFAQGSSVSGTLSECAGVTHVTAGAVNSWLSVTLTDWEGESALLTVTDAGNHPLLGATRLWLGEPVDVQLWQSGEVMLRLDAPDSGAHAYTVSVRCAEGCEQEFTRYPLVLMHGMGGAEAFDGVDYFYNVRGTLEARGYLVRNPTVAAFATTEARAEAWQLELDAMQAEGLGRKFNLLAHSQGGLDARYLISALGDSDRIASLDMVATPNYGTVIADVLSGTIEDGYVDATIVDACTAAFASVYGLDATDASLATAMAALTTETLAAFNEVVLDDPDVYYTSWSGHTCDALDFDCQDAHGDETVEALMAPLLWIMAIEEQESDGLVPVDSAVWGDWQGEIDGDHLDEIGQFEDQENPAFQHLDFYTSEVQRLAGMGF